MIGGYDFNKSEFNRAFQACRQPGSSFKPIVYSAAIEKLDYTPSTILLDAPIVFDDPNNAVRWKPVELRARVQGRRDAARGAHQLHEHPGGEDPGGRGRPRRRPTGRTSSASPPSSTRISRSRSAPRASTCGISRRSTRCSTRAAERVHPTFIRRVVDRDGHVLEDHSGYYDPVDFAEGSASRPDTRRCSRSASR